MKFKILAGGIPILLYATIVSANIEGETSTLIFNGKITEATCALATGSDNQLVDMGNVASNTFRKTGDTSRPQAFSINLTDCDTDVAKTAAIAFSGDTANDNTLKISGDAGNVGIQILQDNTALILDGSTLSSSQTLVGGSNAMQFSARYIALADEVKAGDANATAHFTLYYD
jgi:major type 1 subunit fimbrin (pilin)